MSDIKGIFKFKDPAKTSFRVHCHDDRITKPASVADLPPGFEAIAGREVCATVNHVGYLSLDGSGHLMIWPVNTAKPTFQIAVLKPAPTEPPLAHTHEQPHNRIKEVREQGDNLWVRFEHPLKDNYGNLKNDKNGLPISSAKAESFQATDKALGLQAQNSFEVGQQGYRIQSFGANVPDLAGRTASVQDNPYNFVSFSGSAPWEDPGPHADHSAWMPKSLSGEITIKATAKTPVFVPEGFPFSPVDDAEKEQLRGVARRFCRMPNSEGETRYAIPGASLKGVLRSAVEALTNSRAGVLNRDSYDKRLPYRRRVFQAGVLKTQNNDESWTVESVNVHYVPSTIRLTLGQTYLVAKGAKQVVVNKPDKNTKTATASDLRDFTANLLARPTALNAGPPVPGKHKYSQIVVHHLNESITLPKAVIKEYLETVDLPHYRQHIKRCNGLLPAKKPYATPPDASAITALKDLKPNDLIWFTESNGRITTFGKNVNYLWRSKKCVEQLAAGFFPLKQRSLNDNLSLAETMFGFSGEHKRKDKNQISHPFRGKVRIGTLWGCKALPYPDEEGWPEASGGALGTRLKLAPLTAPETRAKARPLYLAARNDDSGSYDDPGAELKGRKFYWHQISPTGAVIPLHHRYDPTLHADVARQCPPELFALNAGTEFSGAIQFDNLTHAELGALLYALRGDGTYEHAIKIGKGKPRGLGSVQVSVETLTIEEPSTYYGRLDEEQGTADHKAALGDYVDKFKKWTLRKAGQPCTEVTAFSNLDHIMDYDCLHNWSIAAPRYYPINFSDYSWLPASNNGAGEPTVSRPPAMRPARSKPGCPTP